MQMQPDYKNIVLIGGGHSHIAILQKWAKHPLPGARLTLVSTQAQSAHSSMLPGAVAGHYSFDDILIDLPRLCRAAGARFIQASAHRIDSDNKRLSLPGQRDLEFDVLSLDLGAARDRDISGSGLAIPLKSAGEFNRHWEQLKHQLHTEHKPVRIGVVGSGVSGCELAMAMSSALEEPVYSGRAEIHLIHAGNKLPLEYPLLARKLVARELSQCRVRVHRNWQVTEITPRGVHGDEGQFLPLDKVMLCTEPTAPSWLAGAGLILSQCGFVQVDEYLRTDCPFIFAAGETAYLAQNPSANTVTNAFARGDILHHNLRAYLLEQPLRAFHPHRELFRLLACGNRRAVATCGSFAAAGGALWTLKDHFDRRFIARFRALPTAPLPHRPVLIQALQPQPRDLNQRAATADRKWPSATWK